MAVDDDIPRTSVNQAPYGGTDYPFTTPCDLSGEWLDAYVSWDKGDYQLPFTLTQVSGSITVTDANSVVVIATTIGASVSRMWGTSRKVYEWIIDGVVLRLVGRFPGSLSFSPRSGTLDARTCNRMPSNIRSVRVGLQRITGNIVFQNGYNIELSGNNAPTTEGARYISQVNMDAVPGAGIGRLNGCDDLEVVLRQINNVQPDCGGNFIIDLDDCFRGQLPLFMTGDQDEIRTAEFSGEDLTAEEAKHAFKIYSDCHPCCECDYFVRTYRGLQRVWDFWKEDATRAENVRDIYNDNRSRWMESRECRMSHPARLVAHTDKSCKTAIGGSYCNFSTCCLHNIEMRFTMQRYKAAVPVPWTSGTVTEAYVNGSHTTEEEKYSPHTMGTRVVRFFFDYANPQAMSVAKMKFCTTGCALDESLRVTMTVHVASPLPNPHTGDPCTLSTASVPSDIAAIWSALAVPATPTVRATLAKTVGLDPRSKTFPCGC
jgi:hypothetical protein